MNEPNSKDWSTSLISLSFFFFPTQRDWTIFRSYNQGRRTVIRMLGKYNIEHFPIFFSKLILINDLIGVIVTPYTQCTDFQNFYFNTHQTSSLWGGSSGSKFSIVQLLWWWHSSSAGCRSTASAWCSWWWPCTGSGPSHCSRPSTSSSWFLECSTTSIPYSTPFSTRSCPRGSGEVSMIFLAPVSCSR